MQFATHFPLLQHSVRVVYLWSLYCKAVKAAWPSVISFVAPQLLQARDLVIDAAVRLAPDVVDNSEDALDVNADTFEETKEVTNAHSNGCSDQRMPWTNVGSKYDNPAPIADITVAAESTAVLTAVSRVCCPSISRRVERTESGLGYDNVVTELPCLHTFRSAVAERGSGRKRKPSFLDSRETKKAVQCELIADTIEERIEFLKFIALDADRTGNETDKAKAVRMLFDIILCVDYCSK